MWEWIRRFGNDWQEGLEAPAVPILAKPWRAIATLGMGGSAFGAEIVRAWARPYLKLPWEIIRDYRLPAWVDSATLVIAASYSGMTEETLAATEEALRRGASVVGLASGGLLAQWGQEGRLAAFLDLPSGRPPRAAAHLSVLAQFRLLEGAGLIPSSWREEAKALLPLLFSAQHPDTTRLKALAAEWANRLIVFYAPNEYEPIALRARQQVQENAKHLAWHHAVPEMNHNEIVGWEQPVPLSERIAVCLIYGSHTHPRTRLRLRFMESLLNQRRIPYTTLEAPPAPYLTELMWLFHAVDIFSVFLAEVHGLDPTPVPVIDQLKQHLAQQA
ncbi:MAG: SIS domain-containing protein [Bacteroidia bacterium]